MLTLVDRRDPEYPLVAGVLDYLFDRSGEKKIWDGMTNHNSGKETGDGGFPGLYRSDHQYNFMFALLGNKIIDYFVTLMTSAYRKSVKNTNHLPLGRTLFYTVPSSNSLLLVSPQ